jgi:leucyl-tRNA synthetase
MNHYAKVTGEDALTRAVRQEVLQNVVLMLSPIVPHICQALWSELRPDSHITDCAWPEADISALQQDELSLVVQVNGKLRGNITVPSEASNQQVEQLALAQEFVKKFISDGQTVRKIIVVPKKLVNIVVG